MTKDDIRKPPPRRRRRRLAVRECIAEQLIESPLSLRSPQDVYTYASQYQDDPVESFRVLILDTRMRMKRDVLISVGLLDTSLVHPREVFRAAVENRAATLILLHNHPSGDPTPSPQDCFITAQLEKAGKVLDIPVKDHLIVGKGRYYSFAKEEKLNA